VKRGVTREPVVRQALAVVIATSLYGISYGAVAVADGLSTWQACVTSLFLFSGGSQFALAGVIGGGGSAGAAFAASTLLGLRNGMYSLQLSTLLDPRRARRLAAAHVTIDESTAVAVGQSDDRSRHVGFWVTGLGIFLGWNLMTLLGAVVGNALGDPRTYGLDAAAAAAFLALLWPRLRSRETVAVAIAAAIVSAALVPALPVGLPVVVAGGVAVAAGAVKARRHR
jgi:predicted branched-subunit amino acid permease